MSEMHSSSMGRIHLVGALVAIAVAATAVVAPGACAANQEREVDCPEGRTIELRYGDHTEGCQMGPSLTDQDAFRFHGDAGDLVRLVVAVNSNGPDPWMQVRHVATDQLVIDHRGDCRGGICAIAADAVLPEGGAYAISVWEWAFDETGAYDLQLDRILPASEAPTLRYDEPVADTLDPKTDHDFWVFRAREGARVRVIASSRTDGLDPWIQVWGADGTAVIDQRADCRGGKCAVAGEATIPTSGEYTITLFEWAWDERGGDYELSLQCLTPPCGLGDDESGDIVALLEEPSCAGAAGIANIRGYAFATEGELEPMVDVRIDGLHRLEIPCCSGRGDVQAVYPNAPRKSGFSGAFNWSLLEPGTHEIALTFRSTSGARKTIRTQFRTERLSDEISFVRDLDCGACASDPTDPSGVICSACTVSGAAGEEGCFGDFHFVWDAAAQGLRLRSGCTPSGSKPITSRCDSRVVVD